MKKLVKEGLKDIRSCEFLTGLKDHTIKFWLRHMYQEGFIAGLEWTIENNKKNEYL